MRKALAAMKEAFKGVPFLGKLFEAFYAMLNVEQKKEVENLKLADDAVKD
jgi:hypothetical protein